MTRLTKASKYVNQLYELIVASKRCTPRTEAEAKVTSRLNLSVLADPLPDTQRLSLFVLLWGQAYKCWIEGSEAFERKQWERCVKAFTEAKAIYTALLADMKGDDQRTTYVEVGRERSRRAAKRRETPTVSDLIFFFSSSWFFFSAVRKLAAALVSARTISAAARRARKRCCRSRLLHTRHDCKTSWR